MRVTVIGTGYVGTVTGACLAYLGHRVTCMDTDAEKVAKLARGKMPFFEPHLDELVREAAARGGIDFTTRLLPAVAQSDVIFIAVGPPAKPGGEPDLTYLESAAHAIGAAMDAERFPVVVNKSTVPVGSHKKSLSFWVQLASRRPWGSFGETAPCILFRERAPKPTAFEPPESAVDTL